MNGTRLTTTEGRRFRRPERLWRTVFILFGGLFNPALFLALRFDLPITLLSWGHLEQTVLLILPGGIICATLWVTTARDRNRKS